MAKPSAGEEGEKLELLYIPGEYEIQYETTTLENILLVSYKGKHTLAMQLYHPTLGIYPSEMKTCVHTKSCIQMFKVSLFIITKAGNNSNVLCPLWVNG